MKRRVVSLAMVVVVVGVAALAPSGGCALARWGAQPEELPDLDLSAFGPPPSYRDEVVPVLERRCIVCHGCYDAPCQLLLSPAEGLQRGASKASVYPSSRLSAQDPTRLGIDATDVPGWRGLGFFPALPESAADAGSSPFARMLELARRSPVPASEPLPDTVSLELGRSLTCPTAHEFAGYEERHPFGGMPYATAPLTPQEYRTLMAWAAAGAPVDAEPEAPTRAVAGPLRRWEEFLNGASLKQRVTARYLYEHWFVAHLAFRSAPEGPYFRVVRSRTAPGSPIEEIATRRPLDSPGDAPFWYRLRPVEGTIVHKTHILYWLDDARMARLTELFLEPDWTPTRFPSYDLKKASNPFVTFDEIPADSRYRFLLDDAQYSV